MNDLRAAILGCLSSGSLTTIDVARAIGQPVGAVVPVLRSEPAVRYDGARWAVDGYATANAEAVREAGRRRAVGMCGQLSLQDVAARRLAKQTHAEIAAAAGVTTKAVKSYCHAHGLTGEHGGARRGAGRKPRPVSPGIWATDGRGVRIDLHARRERQRSRRRRRILAWLATRDAVAV